MVRARQQRSVSPEPTREPPARRVARDTHHIGAGRYTAMEIHGFFGSSSRTSRSTSADKEATKKRKEKKQALKVYRISKCYITRNQ